MLDDSLGIFEGFGEFEETSTDFDLSDKGVNFWDDDPWLDWFNSAEFDKEYAEWNALEEELRIREDIAEEGFILMETAPSRHLKKKSTKRRHFLKSPFAY